MTIDPKWEERLRLNFKPDALDRLSRAELEYYSKHGHYVPPLAQLALLEQENIRLLADYARHRHDCARIPVVGGLYGNCDCGLDDLLEHLQQQLAGDTGQLVHLGPAEHWFCRCVARYEHGIPQRRMRGPSMVRCGICGATPTWIREEATA